MAACGLCLSAACTGAKWARRCTAKCCLAGCATRVCGTSRQGSGPLGRLLQNDRIHPGSAGQPGLAYGPGGRRSVRREGLYHAHGQDVRAESGLQRALRRVPAGSEGHQAHGSIQPHGLDARCHALRTGRRGCRSGVVDAAGGRTAACAFLGRQADRAARADQGHAGLYD